MKLASIVPYTYLPCHSGGQKAIAALYQYLGQLAEVTVCGSSGNTAALAQHYQLYPCLGSGLARYCNPLLFFRVKRLLQRKGIRTVIIEHPYHAWLGWLLKRAGYTIVLRSHNIEYARFRSIGKWWWPLLLQYEKWGLRLAHTVCFITEEDRLQGIQDFQLSPGRCHVIPFGVPQQSAPSNRDSTRQQLLQQLHLPVNNLLLLFTGSYSYPPNAAAAAVIVQELAPLLALWEQPFTILLTGKGLPEYLQRQIRENHNGRIIYTGFVEDITPYYAAADLLLNTVLAGGGVKTKLVEAIGYGANAVSTETGAKGVDLLLAAPKLVTVPDQDWLAFAEAVKTHAANRQPTGAAFYTAYYWGNIARKMTGILWALERPHQ